MEPGGDPWEEREEERMSSCRSSANKIIVRDQSLGNAP